MKRPALLASLRAGDEAAYVVRCSCDPGPNGDGGQTVVDHIRLFPVWEGVRWSYAVQEQILPALRRANVPVRWTEVTVRHTGYTDPALRESKLQRDDEILEAKMDREQWPVISECGERDSTSSVASIRASTATSACATSPCWPRSAATEPRPDGFGEWSSTPVLATPRPWRAGMLRSESRSLPQRSAGPTTSASVRKVLLVAVRSAPSREWPWLYAAREL